MEKNIEIGLQLQAKQYLVDFVVGHIQLMYLKIKQERRKIGTSYS
tara:strand:+ start:3857 stop:3991 length:135 start_codon:yes stop_codon:yes gene_type:complete